MACESGWRQTAILYSRGCTDANTVTESCTPIAPGTRICAQLDGFLIHVPSAKKPYL
jgi:hypothetical protein